MPIYEEDGQMSRKDLNELRRRNRCKECGERLAVFIDLDAHKAFLACTDWCRTHHEGIERELSRYNKEGLASLNENTRREIMQEQYGTGITTALDRARVPTTGALTQPEAMHILKLVYPNVPEAEIIRAAILCRDFGLHPLMKEVYIIGFKNKDQTTSYSTVIGIAASRKMAADRKGLYSFLDGTPRAATQAEITKQFGVNSEEEKANLISICILRGEKGNEATGFGLWPKDKSPYGMDKGNTPRNMANLRSERPAYSRLPGDVVPPIEVIDEAFAEVPDVGAVNTSTGEILEGQSRSVPDEVVEAQSRNIPDEVVSQPATTGLGNCPIHGIPLLPGKGNFPPYCPTRVDGIGRSEGKKVWCKGKAPVSNTVPATVPETVPETVPTTNDSDTVIDLDWLKESLLQFEAQRLEAWTEGNLLSFMGISYHVEGATVLEAAAKLDRGQAAHFAQKVQETLDKNN